MSGPVTSSLLEPIFAERWVAGTYVVSGIFFLEGDGVTPEKVWADVDSLYRETRAKKKAKWPRGVAGFYIIPIYCGAAFSTEILAWIRQRHPYRWAVWAEPMLYNVSENSVTFREDYRYFGCAFFPYLGELFTTGLSRVAPHYGHTGTPQRKTEE